MNQTEKCQESNATNVLWALLCRDRYDQHGGVYFNGKRPVRQRCRCRPSTWRMLPTGRRLLSMVQVLLKSFSPADMAHGADTPQQPEDDG